MAYARFASNSDVYVFQHVDGGLCCCGCELTRHDGEAWGRSVMMPDARSMLAHLGEHVRAGHLVPKYALDRLGDEADERTSGR